MSRVARSKRRIFVCLLRVRTLGTQLFSPASDVSRRRVAQWKVLYWTAVIGQPTDSRLCVLASPLPAQKRAAETSGKESHSHIHSPPEIGKTKLTLPKLSVPDVEVLDQDGRKRKFYTDFVKAK